MQFIVSYSKAEKVCEKLAWAGIEAKSARVEYVSNLLLKKSRLEINPLFYFVCILNMIDYNKLNYTIIFYYAIGIIH